MPLCTWFMPNREACTQRSSASIDTVEEPCPHSARKVLEGEIVEVEYKSHIKVARNRATVPKPHWEQGRNVTDGNGSQRPGVYIIAPRGLPHEVEVKVRITRSENIGQSSGTLRATLGPLRMTGQCPTAVGTHTVNVTIDQAPTSIQRDAGDVSWTLDVPGDGLSERLRHETRLEVFFVLDTPAGFYQNRRGVWVEALRFLCDRVGVVGISESRPATALISTYCHSNHSLRYDTTRGAPRYGCGGAGGTFQLDAYLRRAQSVVNCYDQAAAVQALSGALGVPTAWLFMQPYGFINQTDLIGVGQCNNPFFASNGSRAVVGQNDPNRTAFGNHAFCEFNNGVYDACAGPHTGGSARTGYVATAIDSTTSLNALYNGFPGTVANISTPAGVTEVG